MKKFLILTLVLILSAFSYTSYADDKNLIIATATPGGTYYPVGVAIGTLISIKLKASKGIQATAINSAGSGENISMMKKKEADLAILQSLFALEAYNGEGLYAGKPEKDFRSITMLWQNVEHFPILKEYVKTGNMSDLANLKGKPFSIGKRGSGTEGSGRVILSALGYNPDKDFRLEFLDYNQSIDAMMNKRVGAANIPAGPPASAITQLYAQTGEKGAIVLDFTDEQLNKIRKTHPIWTRFVIKAGTYPGQTKDINTIGQPNILVVRKDLSEETVYLVTKTIYENLQFLSNIHPATKELSLKEALDGLPVPLHPGAAKFYKEKGIHIPAELMPN
ncbi:MAG: TAXI family TRAP transporter solute-binding subunit [Calditerrivibrio sp.]|nr:TAXI family TRAP transporter solute-binding subunit [Calditerrivibrio sp.]MCA1932485.1 TAXI family TRAP transporter solute-binding subunit [Calditerrivibrio sp.]MCA1980503.1 TAXI family TRAP transporter solute-binding subunit [Calditerrivibrio sp.]